MWSWFRARYTMLGFLWRFPWLPMGRFLKALEHIPRIPDDDPDALAMRLWLLEQWHELDRMAAATGTEIDDLMLDFVEHVLKDPVAWERFVQVLRAVRET